MKFETQFQSDKSYENPLYDVKSFIIHFKSPAGRLKNINGFWDGETKWKVRFCPDELGTWTFTTDCSDEKNLGLHRQSGAFECIRHQNKLDIYTKGAIIRPKGAYHLTHADGTPFFYTACTAWNGALRSTDEEWPVYLKDRVENGYNVIQFVTTQWRGCEANRLGQVAFEGCGRITLNVDFYQYLDKKVDAINEFGLVAAPVLLWALPFGAGNYLSPGYYLPEREAILLARYMVARYGGHHVIWLLGGDGRYIDEFEQRWKNIGRGVFGDEHPGVVAQHPQGRSWIGNAYRDENWLDIVGYQSSHSNAQPTVDWINKGPMAQEWDKLPARPLINLEPNYEEIRFKITAQDVRNASFWSLLATPIAGITYGANGIWPWLREGENILNHANALGTHPWHESIKFPGSVQIGYLAKFFRKLEWWRLRPAPELLVEQPGEQVFNHFLSVAKTDDHHLIVAYLPVQTTIRLYNAFNHYFEGEWFHPVKNIYLKAKIIQKPGIIEISSPENSDLILVLRKKS
ncbi:DUF4038 domain-containing protein [candidate division KSB1 bacterium]|nr:DUF4038 domain-containing protein [candidate division KSB1 bacterium]